MYCTQDTHNRAFLKNLSSTLRVMVYSNAEAPLHKMFQGVLTAGIGVKDINQSPESLCLHCGYAVEVQSTGMRGFREVSPVSKSTTPQNFLF